MKQMKSLFIAVALLFGVSQYASAQKVAHINVQELMENHPDLLKAQKQLETIAETYDKDYRGLVTEFNTKKDKYIAEEATVSEASNQERAMELQNMQKSIQEYAANAQKLLGEKEEELKTPIVDKVRNAIQKVARAKGYEFVLDSTSGSGVLLADGPDLLKDVKKELGITK
jgi:outer membrane protein